MLQIAATLSAVVATVETVAAMIIAGLLVVRSVQHAIEILRSMGGK